MRNCRSLAALGMTGVLIAACERVVAVDVDEAPKRLVVEGRILRIQNSAASEQTIRVSLTSAYFDSSPPPPATGALVRVSDGSGSVTFVEQSPGVYVAALPAAVGRVYGLRIEYAGEVYESLDTLRPVAPIDSLYFLEPEADFGGIGGMRATVAFKETPGQDNWYLWEQLVNGRRLLGPDSLFRLPLASNDLGIDGRELLTFQPFNGQPVVSRDTVVMRQFGISRGMFNYYTAMGEQTTNDGSPFAVPPSSVRGNVRNLTNPARPALGYFFAAEVSEARAVVP